MINHNNKNTILRLNKNKFKTRGHNINSKCKRRSQSAMLSVTDTASVIACS